MILLRRTRHVVFALILLVLIPGCALANSQFQQTGEQRDQADPADPDRNQQQEQALQTLLEELGAMRAQIAEIQSAQNKPNHYWWKGEQPPVWSNWVLAVITVVAGAVAYKAFTHQRDAVRLTQRADVLVDALSLDPPAALGGHEPKGLPLYRLPTNGRVVASFKNFGPTRASDVVWDLVPVVEGVAAKEPNEPHQRPVVIIGANDHIKPSTGPISAYYDADVLHRISTGSAKLRIKATISYRDVFDVTHSTTQFGTYFNGTFRIDDDIRAD